MAYESISVSEVVPADPARIYAAWLSSAEHTAFTGDDASIEPYVGGKHSTFGGYSFGNTVELQPGARIVQTWRAQDFPPGTPDSRVEVTLEATVGGTMVTIFHTEIPSGQSDSYRDSWVKFYLEPLKKYFADAPSLVPKKPAVATTTNGVSKASPAKVAARAKAKPKKAAKARRAPAKKVKAKAKARPRRAAPKAKAVKRAKPVKKAKASTKTKRPSAKRGARKK